MSYDFGMAFGEKSTVYTDGMFDDYNYSYYSGDDDNDTGGSTGQVCNLSEGIRFDAVLLPVLYTLGLILGLLGNGLVLGILAQKGWRGSWSVADTFILHLGVADSLLLLTLPFWAAQAAQEQGWSFGTPLCKIAGAMFTINFYCGIYLLACISLDRYLSIVHATQMYSRRKPWMVQASCLSIWLFSLLLSIPDWIFREPVMDHRRDRVECTHNYYAFSQSVTDWQLASRLLYHIVGFLVPSVVLLFCYSSILLRLRRSSLGLQKHRAVRVILALVLLFFLCWTPYNITLIVDTLRGKPAMPEEGSCDKGRTATETSLVLTIALGCLHACLNPLLYLWECRNFRREVLGRLRGQSKTQTHLSPSLWDSCVAEEEHLPEQGEEKLALNQISLVEVRPTHN